MHPHTDPRNRGGYAGIRDNYNEKHVDQRLVQWPLFDPPITPIYEQMELPFPTDPGEIP